MGSYVFAIKSESDVEVVEIAYRGKREVGYRITTAAGRETLLALDGLTEVESFDEVVLTDDRNEPRRRRWFRRG